jgi:hypothetical protein
VRLIRSSRIYSIVYIAALVGTVLGFRYLYLTGRARVIKLIILGAVLVIIFISFMRVAFLAPLPYHGVINSETNTIPKFTY